jgi:hypothetical protein
MKSGDIHKAETIATIVDGEIVYEKAEFRDNSVPD